MLYRVMRPVRQVGRAVVNTRIGRIFRTREAALRFAAGIACAYVIDDHNVAVAAHLSDGSFKTVSQVRSAKAC